MKTPSHTVKQDRTGSQAIRWAVLAALLVVSAGCHKTDYVPDIILPSQGPTIDATAEFHDLHLAPALVSGKDVFGVEAPNAERIDPADLTRRLEDELLKELDAAGVFSRVTRFDPHPDVLVTGRVEALHERYHPQLWTYVPGVDTITKVLRLKSHVSSGEAKLTLYVLKPDGRVLGTYHGKATFREFFHPTKAVPPGVRLNQALSEAVQEIHEQIARDAKLRTLASR